MNAQDYTESQSKIINRIMEAGYMIKTMSMIGRRCWIVAEKPGKNVFLDKHLMGTIGVRGKLDIEYQQFNYRTQITEDWELANRLKEV